MEKKQLTEEEKIERRRAYSRDYYQRNKERMSERNRKYMQEYRKLAAKYKDVEERKVYPEHQKAYYLEHREKMLQSAKEWRERNRERVREINRRAYRRRKEQKKLVKQQIRVNDINVDKAKSLFKDPAMAAHLQWLVDRKKQTLFSTDNQSE